MKKLKIKNKFKNIKQKMSLNLINKKLYNKKLFNKID